MNVCITFVFFFFLGPNDKDDVCGTCYLGTFTCAGHPGHITLPVPVYNPVFFLDLYKVRNLIR